MDDLLKELIERRQLYLEREKRARVRLRVAREDHAALTDAIERLTEAIVAIKAGAGE